MLPRFHWSDITTVGHYLGVLILLTGVAMLVPAIVALAFGETQQLGAYVAGMGVCGCTGSAFRLLKQRELKRRRLLLLVGFGWIVIGIIASIPLYLSGSYVTWFDALFDAVSSLTSTGVMIARDVDAMSHAQITWHAIMSFLGAQAVITIALYSGFFGEGSRLHLRYEHRDGKRVRARISETWRAVMIVFVLFAAVGTLAVTVVCLTLGLEPVDAVMNGFWLAVCAVSTSGFVPHSADLVYYHSTALQLVLCVLMIAGALSFGVYSFARRMEFKQVARNSELRVYMIWIAALVVFVTIIMTREGVFSTLGGLVQNGLTLIVSAATTCGMQTVYPEQIGGTISDGVVMWMIIAILFGACAYSTGGGIKTVRILQVLYWIRYSILLRLAPDNALVRIKYEQFGERDLSARDATLAMTVFIMYLATAALGSMAFIAYGNDALDSVFEAISYLSNCGMTSSITQDGLPVGLKFVALLLMWVGRVEFIALVAAIVGIVMSIHPSSFLNLDHMRDLRTRKNENRGGTAWRKRKGQVPKGGATACVACLLAVMMCGAFAVPSAQADVDGVVSMHAAMQEDDILDNRDAYHSEKIGALLGATPRQDNRAVSIQGEAIGAPLVADAGHKWVNIKNGKAMIGVLMTNEQADLIESYCAYERTGDIVTVDGVFHIACASHGGELEVHADQIEVVSHGGGWSSPVSISPFVWGLALLAMGAVLTAVRRKMRAGRKK